MRRVMNEEDYEKIITGKLIFNKTATQIAEELGVGETSVFNVAGAFATVQHKDWPKAIVLIRDKGYSVAMFQWACKRLGYEMPRELQQAADERAEEIRKKYVQKQAVQKQVEQKSEPSKNDGICMLKILEALNEQNELLRSLIDVVIPKYVVDMKENNNVNADMLNQSLKACQDKLEGIQVNTRKRGL